jgi:hypothetical protein
VGSLHKRLDTAEMALFEILCVEALVRAELQEMLAVLKTNEAIEPPLYEKVVRILSEAGYVAEV